MNVNRLAVDFDETDARIIAWLVDHFDKHGKSFKSSQIQQETGLEEEIVSERLERFWRYELIEPECRGGEHWSSLPQLLSVAEQLSTPQPKPDRIEDFKQWFRSKAYAVPLWLIGVVIPTVVVPAFVGWWQIIRWLPSN